ncbi:putative peroxidase [Medicago truncatula]|uniref:peroxidase n=1 Tax=Medicago truncatula TaxID=3880 RepID=A2Q4B4_MEDTR|nr:Haem peroxidase, plant/fungal/bacterial [Medicago truncatula]KEH23546.1 peroxidase family protein [Medicago truncatula]RHN47548.1 putative peroxidase [Medicago truncatula]
MCRGCDASIHIDSKNRTNSEKENDANETVRGYDPMDERKETIEVICPLTVSCADIITLARTDVLALSGGPKYNVPTKLIDQKLTLDKSTSLFVSNFASNGEKFVNNFATAMIKMGKIGLLIGNEGEVRKNCRVFNKLN